VSEPILLARHQINDEAWNTLIANARHSVPYAYTWYLDCVSPDWQALVSVESGELMVDSTRVSDHRGTSSFEYSMVMPLPVRKKWGMSVVQQPLFCQYLGLFSANDISEEEVALFLESLNRHFSYISVYDFHPAHTGILRKVLPGYSDFEVQEKATHWLNLEKPYSELAGKYSADRKNNLKKSRRYPWVGQESTDVEPLISLFKEHHADQIQNVQESAYVLLRNLTRILLEKHLARIEYASLQGTLHAGVMIIETHKLGIYIFNAADAVGRMGNARTFLLDAYLRQKAESLKIFDFESPEVASIAQFYESFGAERQEFCSINKNKLPFPFRQLQDWRKRWITST
jgi:hypothetical protein